MKHVHLVMCEIYCKCDRLEKQKNMISAFTANNSLSFYIYHM